MNLLMFISQYWWLLALIGIVLIAVLIIEYKESGQMQNALSCDACILKVNDAGYIWVDVRALKAFEESAILGAIHISALNNQKSKKTPKYIYYCQNGQNSSALAIKNDQLSLIGGFDAWQNQKLPIEKKETHD